MGTRRRRKNKKIKKNSMHSQNQTVYLSALSPRWGWSKSGVGSGHGGRWKGMRQLLIPVAWGTEYAYVLVYPRLLYRASRNDGGVPIRAWGSWPCPYPALLVGWNVCLPTHLWYITMHTLHQHGHIYIYMSMIWSRVCTYSLDETSIVPVLVPYIQFT